MGFFSKVGKFFKKALPVVAPMAAMAIPGVGGLVSGALSGIGGAIKGLLPGDQPVELGTGNYEMPGGQPWWSGVGNAVGGIMNSEWMPSAVAGGAAYIGGRETNAAAAAEAQKNRDFQAAQAQQQMDFQSAQAGRSMDFAGSQSAAQMAFQERMANTSMQRGSADMKAAGFNPMLSFMKGGADVPSGAAATGSMGQGASGHGSQANVVNALGGAVSSALSASKLGAEIDLVKAQTRETDARALESATRLPKIEADTITTQVSASKMREQVQEIREHIVTLRAEQEELIQRATNHRLEGSKKAYYVLFIQQHERAIKEAEAQLAALGVPRARNEAAAEESWFKREVSPFLGDVGRVVGSATDLAGGASRFYNPVRSYRKVK